MEREYVELGVEGVQIRRVLTASGTEALGTLFRYDVEAEIELPIPGADALIGAEAVLTLRDRAQRTRVVSGVVAEASVRALDNERGRAALVIRPRLWRQTLGRDCYAQQECTVVDMVDDVLADLAEIGGGQYRWELTRTYPRYPYRVQYREDDVSYVSRLLEEEGIYAWFDHEASSMAVFADDSTTAADMPGGAELPWVREGALEPAQDAVTQLGFSSVSASDRFSTKSFDPEHPTVALAASVGQGRHEVYDAPGGGSSLAPILEVRVADQRQAASAARAGVNGLATSIRPFPGRVLEVAGHPLERLNGRFFVTAVAVHGDHHLPCSTRFEAIPADLPFRPARATPEAKQAGLQMGQVVGPDGEEVHPDPLARVRVILHWDRLGPRTDQGGTWMRVAQRGAPGSMLFPRMGWNVATFNEEGGVDAPSLICRIHDGEHLPEYPLPGNMTRVVFKTATVPGDGTTNEIYFEDAAEAEEMFIHASRDMTYRIRDLRSEIVGADSRRKVGNVHTLNVGQSLGERVIGDQAISIGTDEKLEVVGDRSKTVTQNEDETVGGSRTLKVGKTQSLAVSGNRQLTVGPAMIDLTLGSVAMNSRDAITLVGGAVCKLAGGDISESAGLASIQAVGGAKVEIAKQDRPLDVRKAYRQVVGGAIVLKTHGRYSDNADTTASWLVGGALDAEAPQLHVEAEKTLRIKCGNSVLTLTTDSIHLGADNVDLSGAHLDANTGTIEHN